MIFFFFVQTLANTNKKQTQSEICKFNQAKQIHHRLMLIDKKGKNIHLKKKKINKNYENHKKQNKTKTKNLRDDKCKKYIIIIMRRNEIYKELLK